MANSHSIKAQQDLSNKNYAQFSVWQAKNVATLFCADFISPARTQVVFSATKNPVLTHRAMFSHELKKNAACVAAAVKTATAAAAVPAVAGIS
jgi:hypothetical protein